MARSFVFRLETVLELRALRERQQRRKLAQTCAALARMQAQVQRLTRQRRREQQDLAAAQSAGRGDPQSWLRRRAWISQLARQIEAWEQRCEQAAAEVDRQRAVWRQKRNELRALQRLRQRRFENWRKNALRRAQCEQDEVAQQLHMRKSALLGMPSGAGRGPAPG